MAILSSCSPLYHCMLLFFLYYSIISAQGTPTVQIDSGIYTGLTVGDGQVDQFLGIQYGDISRFKPAKAFKGPVRANATLPNKACPQFAVQNPLLPGVGNKFLIFPSFDSSLSNTKAS